MEAAGVFAALASTEARDSPYPLYAALHELGEAVEPVPGYLLVAHFCLGAARPNSKARRVSPARVLPPEPSRAGHSSSAAGG